MWDHFLLNLLLLNTVSSGYPLNNLILRVVLNLATHCKPREMEIKFAPKCPLTYDDESYQSGHLTTVSYTEQALIFFNFSTKINKYRHQEKT